VQTQRCELFYFLIKKRVDVFFTNGGLYSLSRGLGRTYLQLKKDIYNLKK